MLWLVLANVMSASACPSPTLAVDLSRFEDVSDREVGELYTSLLVRIVEEHYAVNAPGEASDSTLRLIRSAGGPLRIELVLGSVIRATTLAAGDATQGLAIVHASIELLREARRARPPCLVATDGGAARTTELAVGAAVAGSITLAPRAQVAVELTPGSHVRLAAQLVFAAPLDTPSELSVREAGAAAGLSLVVPLLGGSATWDTTAMIGAWFQRHRYTSPAGARDVTNRFDPAMIAETGITVPVHARVSLGASAGVLAVARAYEHLQDGAMLYQTARLRPLAGLSVACRF